MVGVMLYILFIIKISAFEMKKRCKKDNNLLYAVPYLHYINAIKGYFNNVLKS